MTLPLPLAPAEPEEIGLSAARLARLGADVIEVPPELHPATPRPASSSRSRQEHSRQAGPD